jgi:hypothetical protein
MFKSAQIQIAVIVVLLIGSIVPTAWALSNGSSVADLALGFGTGIGGSLVTFVLITLVLERSAEREQNKVTEKDKLLEEMGSGDNVIVARAVQRLRMLGFLEDGTLQGINLSRANLSGVDLSQSDLKYVELSAANLSAANLQGASLYKATLIGTDLSNANLSGAYLKETDLTEANLSDANLGGANLVKANLAHAKVTSEQLSKVWLLNGAILPNGTLHSPSEYLR